jgi:hypothetical protein
MNAAVPRLMHRCFPESCLEAPELQTKISDLNNTGGKAEPAKGSIPSLRGNKDAQAPTNCQNVNLSQERYFSPQRFDEYSRTTSRITRADDNFILYVLI